MLNSLKATDLPRSIWWDNTLVITIAICLTVGLIPLWLTLTGVMHGYFSCDFLAQIVPLTIEAKRMFATGAPMWSWNAFLGDNFIGSNNFYVFGTPFTLICALFPYKYIGIGVVLCIYLQFILYGITSMAYLSRMGLSRELSRLGALMFALSSFCIVVLFYFNFAIGIIFFPIFLIGIENLIDNKKYSLPMLALISGFMVIGNFYFAAINFIGGSLYFLCRVISIEIGPKSLSFRVKILIRFSVAIILGIMFSAIVFYPSVLATAGSERNVIGFIPGIKEQILLNLRKGFYVFAPDLSEGVGGSVYSTFATFSLYVPCIGFAFIPMYAIRNKTNWLTILLGIFLLIAFSQLNLIMSLGASVDYGRWSYIIILIAILISIKSIQQVDNYSYKKTGIIIYIAVCIVYFIGCAVYTTVAKNGNVLGYISLFSEVGMALIGIVLTKVFLFKQKSSIFLFYSIAVMGTLCISLYMTRVAFKSNEGYILSDLLYNPIDRNNNDKFIFRTDIEGGGPNIGYNKNMQNVRSFHSVMNKAITDFAKLSRRSIDPTYLTKHHRASFNTLVSVRDIITLNNKSDFGAWRYTTEIQEGVDTISRKNGYTLLRNNNYIPMGFSYDSYITEDDFQNAVGSINYSNPEANKDVYRAMLQSIIITSADTSELSAYLKKNENISFDAPLDSVASARRKYCSHKFEGDSRGFVAQINNRDKPRLYFFSVPADPGFTAWLDGTTELKIFRVNLGMSAVIVPKGTHEVQFKYFTPGLLTGAVISLISLALIIGLFILERTATTKKQTNK